jgi:GDP-4-dehydro-6-deoxy-D-mannose reductase
MRRLLVTGHDGFVGTSLLGWLPGSRWSARVLTVHPGEGFDLRDAEAVRRLVHDARPDWILHLAAQSHVPTSFDDPVATLDVNLLGTTRLLQALRAERFAGRLLYVSSADVYGTVDPSRLPIREDTPVAPANPYAVSKAAAELACLQWHRAHGLDVVVARPFNHVGCGQRPEFALAGFARSIAEIQLGLRAPELPVGNLEVTRDFSHVLDTCEGYLALLESGRSGETYNLCSGIERGLGELLNGMLARARCPARVTRDPARWRPADQPRVVGDAGKALRDTGWRAARPLEPLLDEMVDYWKRKLST